MIMKALLFDPFSGASGDMIMGCLLDMGADKGAVKDAVESVGCSVEISKASRGHIQAARAEVYADRRFQSLEQAKEIMTAARLSKKAAFKALRVLDILAGAEGVVHGLNAEQVHFHEIGAMDALADIAGCSAAIDSLKTDTVLSLPVGVGGGTVKTAHSWLPVPAPATLEILRSNGISWRGGPIDTELLTPTGAAILAGWVDKFVDMYPSVQANAVGYGAGRLDLEYPNILRGIIGEIPQEREGHGGKTHNRIVQLETNVDDVTGEVIGSTIDLLIEQGALDVCVIPAVMKKGRIGNIISVISRELDADRLSKIIMRETGSLGIRVYPSIHRHIAQRESKSLDIEIGGKAHRVNIKVAWIEGQPVSVKPEYEECKKIASEEGLPLKEVIRIASEEGWKGALKAP